MEAKELLALIKESRNHDGERLINPEKLAELAFEAGVRAVAEYVEKNSTFRIAIRPVFGGKSYKTRVNTFNVWDEDWEWKLKEWGIKL